MQRSGGKESAGCSHSSRLETTDSSRGCRCGRNRGRRRFTVDQSAQDVSAVADFVEEDPNLLQFVARGMPRCIVTMRSSEAEQGRQGVGRLGKGGIDDGHDEAGRGDDELVVIVEVELRGRNEMLNESVSRFWSLA